MIVLIAGNVAVVPRRIGSAHQRSTLFVAPRGPELCAQPSGPQPAEPAGVGPLVSPVAALGNVQQPGSNELEQ